MGGGEGELISDATLHCHRHNDFRMSKRRRRQKIFALTWAGMHVYVSRFNVSLIAAGQSHETVSINHIP